MNFSRYLKTLQCIAMKFSMCILIDMESIFIDLGDWGTSMSIFSWGSKIYLSEDIYLFYTFFKSLISNQAYLNNCI